MRIFNQERAFLILWNFDRKITRKLRAKFTALEPERIESLRTYLLNRCAKSAREKGPAYVKANRIYWNSEQVQCDLQGHVMGRLIHDRHEYIPWLNSLCPLEKARVLEVGCGSGSSVMAIAEQGAEITGIDVVPEAIDMTRTRLDLFGLNEPRLHLTNATQIESYFSCQSFDIIIFFASLEHMTHPERIASLKAAWNLLPKGGILCVVEAPNRLWFFDDHTSDLPFFHWLPDEIAIEYWKQSACYDHSPVFERQSDEAMLEFRRLGRGVSFHEFELALGPISGLDVLIDRHSFQIRQNLLRWARYRKSTKHRYVVDLLQRNQPEIPPGFFMHYIDIGIRKGSHTMVRDIGPTFDRNDSLVNRTTPGGTRRQLRPPFGALRETPDDIGQLLHQHLPGFFHNARYAGTFRLRRVQPSKRRSRRYTSSSLRLATRITSTTSFCLR